MIKMFRAFAKDESGATAIEYGLIAALVALVGVVAFTALGNTIFESFDELADTLCTSAGGTYTDSADGTAGSCTFS
ncbi:Flp family type IVb pilin [Sneathiella limimaris]|uniref:Flp family type IVb pilin n=1 Tax=Sneathiella limimaris TaxID=1964213 RepID=UPI00146B6E4E|nr:Flp family type IVb pilin [Sneathiella limimaris]